MSLLLAGALLVGAITAGAFEAAPVEAAGGCLDKLEIETPGPRATTFGAVDLAPGETFRATIRHWTSHPTALTFRHSFNSEIRLSPMLADGFPGYASSSQKRGFAADGPFQSDGFMDDGTFTYTNPSDSTTTSFVLEVAYWNSPVTGIIGRTEASGFSTCVAPHSPPDRPSQDCASSPTLVVNGPNVWSEPFQMERNAILSMRMVDERPLRFDDDGNAWPVLRSDFLIRAWLYGRNGPGDSWHYIDRDAHISENDWTRRPFVGRWDISLKNRSSYSEVVVIFGKWIERGYALSTPLDVSVKNPGESWRSTCLTSTSTTVTWDITPSCAADETARMQALVTNKTGASTGYRISLVDPATGDQIHGSHVHTIDDDSTATVALGGIPTGAWQLRMYEQRPDGTEVLVGSAPRQSFDASECVPDVEFVDPPEIDPPSPPVMHPAIFTEGPSGGSDPAVADAPTPGVTPIGDPEPGTELCPADLDMQVVASDGNTLAIDIDPAGAERLYAEASWREKDGFGGYGLKTRGTTVTTNAGRRTVTFFNLPDSMSFAEPARDGIITIRPYEHSTTPACESWTFSTSIGDGQLRYESFAEEVDTYLREAATVAGLPPGSPNPWYAGEFEHDAGRADLQGDWLPSLTGQQRDAIAAWVDDDELRSLRTRFEIAARSADVRHDEYLLRAMPLAMIAAEGNASFNAAARGIDPASIVTMTFSLSGDASKKFQGNLKGAALFAGLAALTSGTLVVSEISAGQWGNSNQDVVEFFGFVANVAALRLLSATPPIAIAVSIIGLVLSIIAAILPDDPDAPKLSDPLSVIDEKAQRRLQAEADSLSDTVGEIRAIIEERPLEYERNDARDVQLFARQENDGTYVYHVLHRVRDSELKEDFGVVLQLTGIQEITWSTVYFEELRDVAWSSDWSWDDESVRYVEPFSHRLELLTFDSALDRLNETYAQLCAYRDDCI